QQRLELALELGAGQPRELPTAVLQDREGGGGARGALVVRDVTARLDGGLHLDADERVVPALLEGAVGAVRRLGPRDVARRVALVARRAVLAAARVAGARPGVPGEVLADALPAEVLRAPGGVRRLAAGGLRHGLALQDAAGEAALVRVPGAPPVPVERDGPVLQASRGEPHRLPADDGGRLADRL